MKQYDAIYARQSIDKADSISIESQIEFCKYETHGGAYEVFQDKGYSGKNTDRPQFQEMLEHIRKGEIKRVIVYKLDRISRSILDFANMMEDFQQHGVEFVSCTEKFDTSTPMGRAMLNICIVFAQLERETIQMRVTDAYASRSKYGFFMGGKVPFGYELTPHTINGKKTSRYSVVPAEAEVVRFIFESYAEPTTSLNDIALRLNEDGIKTKRGFSWDGSMVAAIIKNPAYVKADLDVYEFFKDQGTVLINEAHDFAGTNGCYLYNGRNTKDKRLTLEGQILVLAPHEGLIPSDIWLNARRKCMNNKAVFRPTKAKNSWLIGKIKCAKCGHSLVVRNNNGALNKYFICSYHIRTHVCEGIGCANGDQIEAQVLQRIRDRLSEFDEIKDKVERSDNPRLTELRLKNQTLTDEIDSLMGKVATANSVLMDYINERIVALDKERNSIQSEIRELSAADVPSDLETIKDYMDRWDELSFDDKRATVDKIISSVQVSKEMPRIVWKI